MIGKEVFFASFLLLFSLAEIGCQKFTVDLMKAYRNNSIRCNFSLKYEKVIDPKKLILKWYNPHNPYGNSYTLDVASEKLIQNDIFWRYPSINIFGAGYGFSSRNFDSIQFKNAFLSRDKPIMLFDFSAYSAFSVNYVDACLSIYKIGELLAKFLNELVKAGVDPKDIHLMGLSLGSQLAGNTARAFQRNYRANVGRVTGLDPAGPCFDSASLNENLKKEDADFVDIYNFNRDQMGTSQILGHANFLVDGGGPKQPSCERLSFVDMVVEEFTMLCAHGIASAAYWKHAILGSEHSFKAIKCNNLDEAVRQACDGDEVNAGLGISLSTRGIFSLYYDYSLVATLSEDAIVEFLSVMGM